MKKARAFFVGFALLIGGAALAGVPVFDAARNLLEGLRLADQKEKVAHEHAENAKRDNINDIHQQQIAQLDATLKSLNGSFAPITDIENMAGYEAMQVYAIDDNNPHADRLFGDARVTIEQMIIETAKKYSGHPGLAAAGISPVEFRIWFQSLIKQESNFSIGARSHKAAFGLTQIIPGTAKDLGIFPAYYDSPRLQLDGGARYFLTQMKKFGSVPLALAAYNAGPGAVQKYGGIPPYKETQDYVVKITRNFNNYAAKISGVDSVGTLSPQDMAIAENSNIGDAGVSYGSHSQNIMVQSLTRLRQVLVQLAQTKDVKEAMDLNTYARAEVTRIANVLVRLQAAQRKIEAARYASLFAAYARDRQYLSLSELN